MSFGTERTYKGEPVDDLTMVYWTRFGSTVVWCAPNGRVDSMEYTPWPYPEAGDLDEPDWQAHFQKHTDGRGHHYEAYIEAEEATMAGVVFRHDPQVGIGYVWGLFDPTKEIRR